MRLGVNRKVHLSVKLAGRNPRIATVKQDLCFWQQESKALTIEFSEDTYLINHVHSGGLTFVTKTF